MSEKMERNTGEHPYLCPCRLCERRRIFDYYGWNQHMDSVRTATETAIQNAVNQSADYSF